MTRLSASGDLIAGVALGGLGAFMVSEAGKWVYYGPDGPGPGFFPMWYGIAIIALSLLLVLGSFRGLVAAKPAGGVEAVADVATDWAGVGRALGTWVAFVAAIAAMKPAGFLLSFGCLTFLLVIFVFRKSVLAAIATAVGLAVGFHLLFPVALGVDLPRGPLGF